MHAFLPAMFIVTMDVHTSAMSRLTGSTWAHVERVHVFMVCVIRVCGYICMYTNVHICMHVCKYVFTYAYTHDAHACMCRHMNIRTMYITHGCISAHMSWTHLAYQSAWMPDQHMTFLSNEHRLCPYYDGMLQKFTYNCVYCNSQNQNKTKESSETRL